MGIRAMIFRMALVLAVTVLPAAAQDPRPTPQADPETVVPEGTVMPIVLSAYINTRSTQVGDNFYAETLYPVWVQQRLIIPKGSTIRGTVTDVVRPGKIKGKGQLALRVDTVILPNGVVCELVASFRSIRGGGAEIFDRNKETVQGDSTKAADAGNVARTTTQGALVGGMIDRGTGAAIGAGAGGAVGLATVLLSRGRELVLPPGTQFDIELLRPIRLSYAELDFRRP